MILAGENGVDPVEELPGLQALGNIRRPRA